MLRFQIQQISCAGVSTVRLVTLAALLLDLQRQILMLGLS